MSRGGLLRRFPVLGIRDFRLLLADRLIAPASVGFSIVGVSFAVLKVTNSATDLSYVLAAQIAPRWCSRSSAASPPTGSRRSGSSSRPTCSWRSARELRPPRADRQAPAVGDDRAGGHHRDRRGDLLPRLPGAAPPPGPARPAAGGERDQPAGDEHRPDVGRGRRRPAGGGRGRRLGAGALRHRHGHHRSAAAGHPGLAAGPGGTAPAGACSPNCARAGRSSVRTPGCG